MIPLVGELTLIALPLQTFVRCEQGRELYEAALCPLSEKLQMTGKFLGPVQVRSLEALASALTCVQTQ